jgi:hypothetical protein
MALEFIGAHVCHLGLIERTLHTKTLWFPHSTRNGRSRLADNRIAPPDGEPFSGLILATIKRYEATTEIVTGRGHKPDRPRAFDARAVLANLGRRYSHRGEA